MDILPLFLGHELHAGEATFSLLEMEYAYRKAPIKNRSVTTQYIYPLTRVLTYSAYHTEWGFLSILQVY